MAGRVFLHIGTMKSGTTSIQDWCDLNQDRLAEMGVLWSHSEQNFAAVKDLLGGSTARPWHAGSWARMNRKIREHPGDVLISNEILSFRPRAKVRQLVQALAPAEVHVIITARDLSLSIPSQWQESVRNGHTLTLDRFVSELIQSDLAAQSGTDTEPSEVAAWFWRRQDVARLVERWRRFVPLERITLVTVPRRGGDAPGKGGLLHSRIASVVGFDPAMLAECSPRHASLGAHSAELMRQINMRAGHLDRNHYRDGLQSALAQDVLASRAASEPPIRLTPEQLAWARGRAEAFVDYVKQSEVPVVGDVEELIPRRDGAPGWVAPAAATLTEIADIALDGLVGMAEVHARLRHDYEALIAALAAHLGWDLENAVPGLPGEPASWATGEELLRQRGRHLMTLLEMTLLESGGPRQSGGKSS